MRILATLLVSCACLSGPAAPEDVTMKAHFIDVGQGAATLLEFPCGAVLIDTGGPDAEHVESLLAYLDQFFARRTDLKQTLDAIYITHPHLDHTRGLRRIVERYTIKRYVDNGRTTGSGWANVQWVRKVAGAKHIKVVEVTDEDIPKRKKAGLHNDDVDPVCCPTCDPHIVVLSGGYDENPGWSETAYENLNNQSLVIRVDFGKSSFLFGGDLEEEGIGALLDRYDKTGLLDVDVYHVGHHGSYNATTEEYLKAMTPRYCVIPMGHWDDGMNPPERFNTYAFGHPRRNVVQLLIENTEISRTERIVRVADRAKKFSDLSVGKAVYGTGWDGTILFQTDREGHYGVTCSQN